MPGPRPLEAVLSFERILMPSSHVDSRFKAPGELLAQLRSRADSEGSIRMPNRCWLRAVLAAVLLLPAAGASSAPEDAADADPDAWPATVREDSHHRDYDLYLTTVTEAGDTHAKPLITLNTAYNEGAPAVSSFGDFLYFASDRPGGEGGFLQLDCLEAGF